MKWISQFIQKVKNQFVQNPFVCFIFLQSLMEILLCRSFQMMQALGDRETGKQ